MAKKVLTAVMISAVLLSACSFQKEFFRQPLAVYLSPDITSLTLFKRTQEFDSLIETYFGGIKSLMTLPGKTVSDLKADQRTGFYKKLSLEKFQDKDVNSDFAGKFYIASPRSGFLDAKRFIELSKIIDNPSQDKEAALKELSSLIKAVLIYELKQDLVFSDFYKALVKSLKKQEELKLNSEEYLGYTIYTLNGALSQYFLSGQYFENLLKVQPEIKKFVDNFFNQLSFVNTGDYVFLALQPEAIKAILKGKDVDNSELKTRLEDLDSNQDMIFGYSNIQVFLEWYKELIKETSKNLPTAGLEILANIEAVGSSDLSKLPLYSISRANLEGNRFYGQNFLYKNSEIIKKQAGLEKVPTKVNLVLPDNKIENVIANVNFQDVNGQIDYLKALALASGVIDEPSIQAALAFASNKLPIFNVLKSDLKEGSDFSVKFFATYNPDRIGDQPVMNLLLNLNDAEKTLKDIENAVAIYNKTLEREAGAISGFPYDRPVMKFQSLGSDFAKIVMVVNESLADFVKTEEKSATINAGTEKDTAYIGIIPTSDLMYIGFVGSRGLGEGQPKEVFEKIFDEIKGSEIPKEALDESKFTNSIQMKFGNLVNMILASQKLTKEEALDKVLGSLRKTIESQKVENTELFIDMYGQFFEALLRLDELKLFHKVENPSLTLFDFELTFGKERVKRTPSKEESKPVESSSE